MSLSFSSAVLVGGSSRRMGRDKALLVLDGVTLVQRTVALLRGLDVHEVLLVGADVARLGDLGVDGAFEDDVAGAGPLGGILTGLRRMALPRGLFVACDMPRLDPRAVGALLDEASSRGAGADLVVPRVGGRLEPLHAVYAKSCIPAIERQIASGDLRVRALAAQVATHFWDPGSAGVEPSCFENVNTPDDLARLRSPEGGRAGRAAAGRGTP